MATDGTFLIMSDGTHKLTYFDPSEPGKAVKTLAVTENGYKVDSLNELEYIDRFIYANVWLTENIIKIDPQTGAVVGKLDLSAIVREVKSLKPNSGELNGIAYDEATKKVYVTGKLWPKIYEINFKR